MSIRGLVKKLIPTHFFHVVEPYGHLTEAFLFNLANGFPGRKFKIIGVTGTNGKTTTAFLIHQMLVRSGYKVGLMTTVGWGVNDEIKPQIEHMTNVTVPQLMERLRRMKDDGVDWLVLETTSQALAQNRVWGMPYSIAVMTNVTHEHLDYHKTFERYVAAKRKMFEICNSNSKGMRLGIINADDPSADTFKRAIANSVLYGVDKGNLKAKNIELKPTGISYKTSLENVSYHITCQIPGNFNVYNSLAAVAVGHRLGLSKDQIEQGIAVLKGVEGRMTNIDEGQAFSVIVDFAHTPDAFEKLLHTLRPVVKGKLIVLFGSAGRRDEAKRAIQGQLAGKYADEVVLTEEDDRDVDGNTILIEIAAGAVQAGKKADKDLFLILDRTKAIEFALNRAKNKDDTVLLLGKGHEKTIERSDGEHPWDEIGTAHAALKKILAS